MAARRPARVSREREFLAAYDPRAFPPVAVTVDVAVLTLRAGSLSVLLVQRGEPPYEGAWALPGGFVRTDESLDAAAARELAEETGVTNAPVAQLATYGDPDRDPRMRVVSVAYVALVRSVDPPVAGTDAAEARLWPVEDVVGRRRRRRTALAFDHARIVADAVERARDMLRHTPVATALVDEPFTLSELRHVYEAVWGVPLDPANFRRKVLSTPGFVTPYDATRGGVGRPAALYRAAGAVTLDPPMPRPA